MSKHQYGVSASSFREAILVGRLNKDGTEYTDKHDATDAVLMAVADYALKHWDGGLALTLTSQIGSPDLVLTVTVEERKP